MVLLGLTFVQLYLGALVAGLRAGLVYNTWPDIDGGLVPAAARLFFEAPWWRNLFDNTLTVQFEHRMTAYTLFALAILHALDAIRSRAGVAAIRGALVARRGDHAAGDARDSDAAPSRPDRSRSDAPGRGDRGADARGCPGRTPGRATIRAAARAVAAAGHQGRLICGSPDGAQRNPGIAMRMGWPRISLRSIRATGASIQLSNSQTPSLRGAPATKQSMARQAEVWIASSLALLAMTAEDVPATRGRPSVRDDHDTPLCESARRRTYRIDLGKT